MGSPLAMLLMKTRVLQRCKFLKIEWAIPLLNPPTWTEVVCGVVTPKDNVRINKTPLLTCTFCFIKSCTKLHSHHNSFNLKELKTTIHKIVIGIIIYAIFCHILVFIVLRQGSPNLRNGVLILTRLLTMLSTRNLFEVVYRSTSTLN